MIWSTYEDSLRSGNSCAFARVLSFPFGRYRLRTWLAIPRERRIINSWEHKGYEIIITTDQNLKYQQNLGGRKVAIVVLMSTSWPRIRKQADSIVRIVEAAAAGSYEEISIP